MIEKPTNPWNCPRCGYVLANNLDGALRVAGKPARFCISGGRIIAACNKCGEVSEYRSSVQPHHIEGQQPTAAEGGAHD